MNILFNVKNNTTNQPADSPVINRRYHKSEKDRDHAPKIGKSNHMKLLSFPYILWMTGFIIIPLLMILYYGLSDNNNQFTLDNIALITDPINQKALLLALELSIISTVICLLLAYPLAMILSKSSKNSNNFIVL
ncbi:MAG TPA: hypothetical protein DHW85_03450, partial [Lachnospiraceae bacterium]|nr:hypothetical protein [Lachnospiraceae bacterium]